MSRELRRRVRAAVAVLVLALAGRAAAQVDLPVAELDPYFKGGREGHVYTNAMLELGMRMGAATTAALRDDRERALAALKGFREQYAKVAALVPSWRDQFRGSLLAELESAVAAKADLATRRKIVSRIERSCTACHARYMFPVQARFRWGDFASASVPGDRRLINGLATTIGTIFPSVYTMDIPGTLNTMIFATKQKTIPENFAMNLVTFSQDPNIHPLLLSTMQVTFAHLNSGYETTTVYTDDHAPIEWIVNDMVVRFALSGRLEGLGQ